MGHVSRVAFVFAVLLAGRSLDAQQAAAVSNEPLALINANLVHVREGRVTPNATVVLRNGRIESVGPGAPPAGVKAVDLKGKFVLPGLVDAHTHAADFGGMRRALESGVTTVRSAGVSAYVDVGFRELSRKGAIVGPDVVAAGCQIRPQLAQEAV